MTDANEILINGCYNLLVNLIKQTDALLLEGFNRSDKTVAAKDGSNWNLVTYYDQAIEDLLIKKIQEVYPTHK